MPSHRPLSNAPAHIENIPLSKQLGGSLGRVALFTWLAGLALYTGLMSKGWALRVAGARLDPSTSRFLVTLLGGLLTLFVASGLTKLLTLHRAHPFTVHFGAQALVLPTVTFLRGLRTQRIPWAEIESVSVRKGQFAEVVDIRTSESGTITLPGQFCIGRWRPARIAEAIRQEAARHGSATS